MKKYLIPFFLILTAILTIACGGSGSSSNSGDSSNNGDGSGTAKFELLAATDGDHGRELWRTDGTTGGTTLVKDIWPGAETPIEKNKGMSETKGSGNPGGMTLCSGKYFFTADDGVHGTELWVSDGTETGTTMVKDINTSPDGSYPQDFTVIDGKLYFNAFVGASNSTWVSDGTPAGTNVAAPWEYHEAVSMNNKIYFSKDNTPYGLWVLNNSTLTQVSGLNAGMANNLTVLNDSRLFFTMPDVIPGYVLWVYDGTTPSKITSANIPKIIGAANGKVYFYTHPSMTYDIWVTDGATTTRIKTGLLGRPSDITVVDDKLYFNLLDIDTNIDTLWVTDGTEGNTKIVDVSLKTKGAGNYTALNGKLYFTGMDRSIDTKNERITLWVSDGTAVKTVSTRLHSLVSMHVLNGKLIFSGWEGISELEPGTTGMELWASDGTDAGTSIVKDIYTGTYEVIDEEETYTMPNHSNPFENNKK